MELPWVPPAWVARGVERVRGALQGLHRRTTLPPLALLELAMGAWLSQALYVAAKLGVADALADGPRTAAELGLRLQVDPTALTRLLRALSAHGVFACRADGRYAQNALSGALCRDTPGSLRDYVLFLGHPRHRARWSTLEATVRDGHAAEPFEVLLRDPELGRVFDEGMTCLARLGSAATRGCIDYRRFGTIVDVGGGRGAHLAGILREAPGARGVLFDLAEVTAHAVAHPRMRVEHGSFFECVPEGGDAYVLKHVLHDWSDARALLILRNVRAAMLPHARLILIESVLPEGGGAAMAKLIDLEMLVIDGMERTERAWRELLARAGFALESVTATAGPVSVLEARLSGTSGA